MLTCFALSSSTWNEKIEREGGGGNVSQQVGIVLSYDKAPDLCLEGRVARRQALHGLEDLGEHLVPVLGFRGVGVGCAV